MAAGTGNPYFLSFASIKKRTDQKIRALFLANHLLYKGHKVLGNGVGFTGFYFGITRLLARQVQIGSIDHGGHRFRTEIMMESLVIPDNPELVLLIDFVRNALSGCGILQDNPMEWLAV